MPNEPDRSLPELPGPVVVVSLVAAVACALAGDAHASGTPMDPIVDKPELAARVAAVIERIRQAEPTILRDLPPDLRMAQWRND
jgi:hypothetical protein